MASEETLSHEIRTILMLLGMPKEIGDRPNGAIGLRCAFTPEGTHDVHRTIVKTMNFSPDGETITFQVEAFVIDSQPIDRVVRDRAGWHAMIVESQRPVGYGLTGHPGTAHFSLPTQIRRIPAAPGQACSGS